MAAKNTVAIVLSCSIILNVFLLMKVVIMREEEVDASSSWTNAASAEAEAIASISCSGHGRAFLDGVLLGDRKPICECNACFQGPDCSLSIPNCEIDADSGDPMFLEPFWLKNAAKSSVMMAGWHRMSYEFNDGSLISKELKSQILKLHSVVGNANTTGRYILFGGGATHLLNAAVHALSSSSTPTPSRVVASVPYYPVYKEQTEFFQSTKNYMFYGDARSLMDSNNIIELVTSPNNPDGKLNKAVVKGETVKKIYDLAYYWPHFTAIPSPGDEDLMIFTLSKITGHAGSRFGWAIIKDKAVYEKMVQYMSLSTYGVPRETQLRALKLLKVVVEENGIDFFGFGSKIMRNRWKKLSNILSKSTRFSLQDLDHKHCYFSKKIRAPSPAFAWLKCRREEDKDCFKVLKSEAKITGRHGSLFGAESKYVRLSLVKSQDDFDLLLQRMETLIHQQNNNNTRRSGLGNSSIPFDFGHFGSYFTIKV